MQACNFPKQSDRVECRCSQAGMVQREPEFSFDRGSDPLVRIPFHHESSVPEVPSASVGPDPRGRNSAGHRHAGHYPRHHGARGAEKGTQLESITSCVPVSTPFHPDGTRIASAGADGTVRLWEASGGREILTLHGHHDRVHGVAFSPDGARLASASADGVVRIWKTEPQNEPVRRS